MTWVLSNKLMWQNKNKNKNKMHIGILRYRDSIFIHIYVKPKLEDAIYD